MRKLYIVSGSYGILCDGENEAEAIEQAKRHSLGVAANGYKVEEYHPPHLEDTQVIPLSVAVDVMDGKL